QHGTCRLSVHHANKNCPKARTFGQFWLWSDPGLLFPAADQAGEQGAHTQQSEQRQRRSGLGKFLSCIRILVRAACTCIGILVRGVCIALVTLGSILVSTGAAGGSCVLVSGSRRGASRRILRRSAG